MLPVSAPNPSCRGGHRCGDLAGGGEPGEAAAAAVAAAGRAVRRARRWRRRARGAAMRLVALRRTHAGLTFLTLRDCSGMVRVTTLPEYPEVYDVVNKLRVESVVAVEGVVRPRPTEVINAEMKTNTANGHCSPEYKSESCAVVPKFMKWRC